MDIIRLPFVSHRISQNHFVYNKNNSLTCLKRRLNWVNNVLLEPGKWWASFYLIRKMGHARNLMLRAKNLDISIFLLRKSHLRGPSWVEQNQGNRTNSLRRKRNMVLKQTNFPFWNVGALMSGWNSLHFTSRRIRIDSLQPLCFQQWPNYLHTIKDV